MMMAPWPRHRRRDSYQREWEAELDQTDMQMLDLLPELARRLEETPVPPPPSERIHSDPLPRLSSSLSRLQQAQLAQWVEAHQVRPYHQSPLLPSDHRIQDYSADPYPYLSPRLDPNWHYKGYREGLYPQQLYQRVQYRNVYLDPVSVDLKPLPSGNPCTAVGGARTWPPLQRLHGRLEGIREGILAAMSRKEIQRSFSPPAVGVTETGAPSD